MKYKNKHQVKVGDIAIKDDSLGVIVTAVYDNGFRGLTHNGEHVLFFTEKEAEEFSFYAMSSLRDDLNKLKRINHKQWFSVQSFEQKNMLLAQLIGKFIKDKNRQLYYVFGFAIDTCLNIALYVRDERSRVENISLDEYSIDGVDMYEYFYNKSCKSKEKISQED